MTRGAEQDSGEAMEALADLAAAASPPTGQQAVARRLEELEVGGDFENTDEQDCSRIVAELLRLSPPASQVGEPGGAHVEGAREMPEPRTLFVEAAPASSQEQLAALRVEYIEVFGTHARSSELMSDAKWLHARIQSAKSSCEHYLPYIWSEIARVSSFARRLGFDNTIRLLTRFPGALEVVLWEVSTVTHWWWCGAFIDEARYSDSV
jgi:hypothetical protein